MKKILFGFVFVFTILLTTLGVSAESSKSFNVEDVQFYDSAYNACSTIGENSKKLAVSYSAMDFPSNGGYAFVIMCIKDADEKIAEIGLKKIYINPGVHFGNCVFDIENGLENGARAELYFLERGCIMPFANNKVYAAGRKGTYAYSKNYETLDLYSSDIDFASSNFSGRVYYYTSSSKKNVKMSADTKMYLNFSENNTAVDVLKSLSENEFATVKLIDKNSDGIYDTLYAVVYKYTVARNVYSDGTIFTYRSDDIDPDVIGALKNSSGEIINPYSVKKYDVLAVAYEDYNDSRSDIISAFTVDVPKILGEAESFSETDGKITVNSKEYKLLPEDDYLRIDYPYEGKGRIYGYFLRGLKGEVLGYIEKEDYDDNTAFILSADDTSMTFITNKGNIETHNYADEIYFENLCDTTRYSGSVNISSAYSYTGRNTFQNTCFEDYIPAGAVVKDVFASLYAKNKIITDETKEDEAEFRIIKYSLDKNGNIKTIVPNTTRSSSFRGYVSTRTFDAVNKKLDTSYVSDNIAVFDINWTDFEKSTVLGYDFFRDGYIYKGVLTDYDDYGDKMAFVKLAEGVKSESDICGIAVIKSVKEITSDGQSTYKIRTIFNERSFDLILPENDIHQTLTNVSASQINIGTIISVRTDCDYNLLSYSVVGQVDNDLKFTFNNDFKNNAASVNDSYYLGAVKNAGRGYLDIDPIESINSQSVATFYKIGNLTNEVLFGADYNGKLKVYIGDASGIIDIYDNKNYIALVRTTDDGYFDKSTAADIFVFDKTYTNAQIEEMKAAAK